MSDGAPLKLHETLRALGIPEAEGMFAADWDELVSMMPEPVPFLEPEYVAWASDLAHLSPEMTAAVLAAARHVAGDAALRALAWYWHAELFIRAEHRAMPRGWPMLIEAMGNDAGLLNVLVVLSGTPLMLEIHKKRGIPYDVTDATMLDLRLQLETRDFLRQHGQWGISPYIMGWLLWHWRGELVRLGRLQFATSSFGGRLRAYRQRRTGAVVALADAGTRFRPNGDMVGKNETPPNPDTTWVASLEVSDEGVKGYPISPWGHALAEPILLPKGEWEQALAPGDPNLDIHIASGSPMDYDQCGESIRWALDFFPRHFPDRPFAGFACWSWILDPQFESLLPASSNLVRFQREVYLYPVGGDSDVISTVFGYGHTADDLSCLPRKTTMQRAFAAHLESGGHFRDGGCFLLKEDVSWGSTYYRTHWPF